MIMPWPLAGHVPGVAVDLCAALHTPIGWSYRDESTTAILHQLRELLATLVADTVCDNWSHMHYAAIAQILTLLTLANGSPVVGRRIVGDRFSLPLDGGRKFIDGRPIFGASKTIRGLLISILATAAGAPLVGVAFEIGLLAGATAMAGDLCSSFVKRRLGLAPSSKATGLDQIPESLFPLLACRAALALTAADIAAALAIFMIGEVLLSRLLFALHVRDRPY
jgi:hypothetical protein